MNTRRFSKYLAITQAEIMNGAAYPVDLLTRSITIVLFMWVLMHMLQQSP